MIDMIRVGRTRNLLRASSSLSEIWPRPAHLHLGQRHLSGRTNRPDKSPHSITCLRFRNSLQMRAASTREGWIPSPSPPPSNPSYSRFSLLDESLFRDSGGFAGVSASCARVVHWCLTNVGRMFARGWICRRWWRAHGQPGICRLLTLPWG